MFIIVFLHLPSPEDFSQKFSFFHIFLCMICSIDVFCRNFEVVSAIFCIFAAKRAFDHHLNNVWCFAVRWFATFAFATAFGYYVLYLHAPLLQWFYHVIGAQPKFFATILIKTPTLSQDWLMILPSISILILYQWWMMRFYLQHIDSAGNARVLWFFISWQEYYSQFFIVVLQ